jgi:hypothetical protein
LFLVTLAALFIFAAIFAEAFLFVHLGYAHTGHDHAGENCSVCLQQETARNLFKTLAPAAAFFPWPEGRAAPPEGFSFFSGLFLPDPVSLKVRFNS